MIRSLVIVLNIMSLSACTTNEVQPHAQCSEEMQFAERDLSGRIAFERGGLVYRTESGELCESV